MVLVKMNNGGTQSVIDSFSSDLNGQSAELCKSMTYDQGREIHGHKILTERIGVQIYVADPHSP
jgi:IS30 family transposase